MSVIAAQGNRTEQALESAAELFERVLLESETASAVREHLADLGLDEDALREFGVGYALGDLQGSLDELTGAGFTDEELDDAGIATRSRRGHLQPQFRSRVMFPMRDAGGRIEGFTGMATNPGPSWPLWLTSPERGRYSRSESLFAIDAAREAIESTGRVVVLTDCLDVLLAHQGAERATVAVIRSPVMRGHLEHLAAVLGVRLEEIWVDRGHETEDGANGTLVVRADARTDDEMKALTRADVEPPRTNPALRSSEASIAPDAKAELTAGGHLTLWAIRLALGLAIPLGWIAVMSPSSDDPDGGSTAFVIGVGGVALTYAILTVVGSVISARIRARSRARRMRTPWERGATEWQPPAWTYHLLEEVLIGAAVISVFVCLGLFVTIGGFTS